MAYPPSGPYPSSGETPYSSPNNGAYPPAQNVYPPSQPGAYPPPQGAYPPPQPGAYPPPQPGVYPPPQGAYPPPQPGAYPPPGQPGYGYPQGAYPPPNAYGMMKNNRATYALVYGIISLVLALLTFASGVGFAGFITGTFAIVYGVQSRNTAKRFPGLGGEGKAIAGIVLGAVALLLLVLSLLTR